MVSTTELSMVFTITEFALIFGLYGVGVGLTVWLVMRSSLRIARDRLTIMCSAYARATDIPTATTRKD